MTLVTKEKILATYSAATLREQKVWRAHRIYEAALQGTDYFIGHVPMFALGCSCGTKGARMLGLPVVFTDDGPLDDIALVDASRTSPQPHDS
jgi:hypothetical protein